MTPPEENPVSTTPTYDGDWWNHLPSVDGEPPRLVREPEMIPTPEGQAYLDELAAQLEQRAAQPDVQAFIERNQHDGEDS